MQQAARSLLQISIVIYLIATPDVATTATSLPIQIHRESHTLPLKHPSCVPPWTPWPLTQFCTTASLLNSAFAAIVSTNTYFVVVQQPPEAPAD